MRFLACFAIRTEPCQVEFAEDFPDVLFAAVGSERAEAFVVVWAWGQFGVGVDVEV